jgi:hypothetical protein
LSLVAKKLLWFYVIFDGSYIFLVAMASKEHGGELIIGAVAFSLLFTACGVVLISILSWVYKVFFINWTTFEIGFAAAGLISMNLTGLIYGETPLTFDLFNDLAFGYFTDGWRLNLFTHFLFLLCLFFVRNVRAYQEHD